MTRIPVVTTPSASDDPERTAQHLEAVRQRAYERFLERGGSDGHDLDDWLAAEDEVLGRATLDWVDGADAYEIDLALDEYLPDQIQVNASPHALVVRAATEQSGAGDEDGDSWSTLEWRELFRRFVPPEPIDPDAVSATFQGGVLHVIAPKRSASPVPGSTDASAAVPAAEADPTEASGEPTATPTA